MRLPDRPVTATIEFSEQVRGGLEPAETVTACASTPPAFTTPAAPVKPGQESGPLDTGRLADVLRQQFDTDHLLALLGRFVDLHDALLHDTAGPRSAH